ncbi:MAG: pilin [Patescibacteria group bacterium]
MPTVASAVDWFPIVPCGSSGQAACTPCDLFKTFKNVIDLVLYGITGPIAAFMIVWAGGLMLISGDNAARFAEGSKMLKNTLIGVTIILLSWRATNTLIKTLATGNAYDAWFEFSCPAYLQQPEAAALPAPVPAKGSPEKPAPELALASAAACKEANLAAANKVPNNTRLISSSLNTLIACINRDPIVSALYDSAQLYTYERDNPLCNLTHGVKVCGPKCQHEVYSCHYGGRNGNQGAMAVDYNWKKGNSIQYEITTRRIVPKDGAPCKENPSECRTVNGEPDLFDEVYRALVKNRCDYKLVNFERDHTHVSTKDCGSDGVAARGREPPILP